MKRIKSKKYLINNLFLLYLLSNLISANAYSNCLNLFDNVSESNELIDLVRNLSSNAVNEKGERAFEVEYLDDLMLERQISSLPRFIQSDPTFDKKTSPIVIDVANLESDRAQRIYQMSKDVAIALNEIFTENKNPLIIWMLDKPSWSDLFDMPYAISSGFGSVTYYIKDMSSIFLGRSGDPHAYQAHYSYIKYFLRDTGNKHLEKIKKAFGLKSVDELDQFLMGIESDILFKFRHIQALPHEIGHHYLWGSGIRDRISDTVTEILAELISKSVDFNGFNKDRKASDPDYEKGFDLLDEVVFQIFDGKIHLEAKKYLLKHPESDLSDLINGAKFWYNQIVSKEFAQKYSQIPGFTQKLFEKLLAFEGQITDQIFVFFVAETLSQTSGEKWTVQKLIESNIIMEALFLDIDIELLKQILRKS
ncbi:MAG: hypothetical protein ABIA04_10775 [Pseudomonadota bacterium]